MRRRGRAIIFPDFALATVRRVNVSCENRVRQFGFQSGTVEDISLQEALQGSRIRLRDSACWRSGEITQPRTSLIWEPCIRYSD